MIESTGSCSRVELQLQPPLREGGAARVPLPTGIPVTAELALAPAGRAPVSVELGLRPHDIVADRIAETVAPVVIRGTDEPIEESPNLFEFRISWTAKDGRVYSYRLPVEDPEQSKKANAAFAIIKAKHPSLNRLNLLLLIGNGIDIHGDPELAEAITQLRTIYDQIRQKRAKIDWNQDINSFEPSQSEAFPPSTLGIETIRTQSFEQIIANPVIQKKLGRITSESKRSEVLFSFWMVYHFVNDLIKEIDVQIESKKRDLKREQGQKETQLKSELRSLEQRRAELKAVDLFAIAYVRCSDETLPRSTASQHAQALSEVLAHDPSSFSDFVRDRTTRFFANNPISQTTQAIAERAWIKRVTLLTARTPQEVRILYDDLVGPPSNSAERALMRFLRGKFTSEKEVLKELLKGVGLETVDAKVDSWFQKIAEYRSRFTREQRKGRWILPPIISLGRPVDPPQMIALPDSPTIPVAAS